MLTHESGVVATPFSLPGAYTLSSDCSLILAGDFTVQGTFTFGNASMDSLILLGRVSTMTAAGSAIDIGASYTYGQLWEIRSSVSSWTGVGDAFTGYYFRAEAAVASGGKGIRTVESYAIANATFSIDNLQAGYFEAGMKASGTQTIKNANALEASLAPYTGTGAITITNHWECLLCTPSGVSSRIDASNAAKIHGVYVLCRDGDGANTKLGSGIEFINDASQSGTRTLTDGVKINIAATTGINVAGATTTGLLLAGTATDGISITGICTDAIHISGSNTATGLHISGNQVDFALFDVDAAADNGLKIAVDDGITLGTGLAFTRTGTTGVCTTAISIDTDGTTAISIGAGFTGTTGIAFGGTATNAIDVTGSSTTALNVGTGVFGTGIVLGGTLTTGVSIGACTTGIDFTGAIANQGINFDDSSLTIVDNMGRNKCFIGIGTYGDHISLNLSAAATSGDRCYLTQMFVDSVANPGHANMYLQGAYYKMSVTTATQANLQIAGFCPTMDIDYNVKTVVGVKSELDMSATGLTIGANAFAISGYLLLASSGALDAQNCSGVAAITADFEGGTGLTLTGTTRSFALKGNVYNGATATGVICCRVDGSGIVTDGISIELGATASMTNAIAFNAVGGMTYLFDFESVAGFLSTTSGATTPTHKLKVNVAGADRYIKLYSDA